MTREVICVSQESDKWGKLIFLIMLQIAYNYLYRLTNR